MREVKRVDGLTSFIESMTESKGRVKNFLFFSLSIFVFGVVLISLYVLAVIVLERDALALLAYKHEEVQRFEAQFNFDRFHEELSTLVVDRGAVSAAIWRVDMSDMTKHLLSSYSSRSGSYGRESLEGKSAPIFVDDESRARFTHVLEGNVVCTEYESHSPVERSMQQLDPATHVCYISAPPRIGSMIGAVAVYFDHKPTLTHALRVDMNRAAKNITEHD